jgi:hypothetical protein
MIEEERLKKLLREALPTKAAPDPSRDLWPEIVARDRAPTPWSWLDLGIAVAVAILLLLRPEWLRVLAYHL